MDAISWPANDRAVLVLSRTPCEGLALPVFRHDARSPTSFKNRMNGNEPPLVQNADHVRQLMDFDNTARAVRNGVVVAANRDEAVVADSPFELQERIERRLRQGLKLSLLSGEGFDNHTLRRAVNTHIGNGLRPFIELCIEIVEIAEVRAKKKSCRM